MIVINKTYRNKEIFIMELNKTNIMEVRIISTQYTDCKIVEEAAERLQNRLDFEVRRNEFGCLGIIDYATNIDGMDSLQVVQNGESTYEMTFQNGGISGIRILLLSHHNDKFVDIIDDYVANHTGVIVTQKRTFKKYMDAIDIYAKVCCPKVIDVYADDLDGIAHDFIADLELKRFKAGYENRIFSGFYYGKQVDSFKKGNVNFFNELEEVDELCEYCV